MVQVQTEYGGTGHLLLPQVTCQLQCALVVPVVHGYTAYYLQETALHASPGPVEVPFGQGPGRRLHSIQRQTQGMQGTRARRARRARGAGGAGFSPRAGNQVPTAGGGGRGQEASAPAQVTTA